MTPKPLPLSKYQLSRQQRTPWLADVLRAAGLDVHETPDWEDRGRAYPYTPIGVMVHHTASGRTSGTHPSLGVVLSGRDDIPGPLAQLLIGRDGTVWTVAAGPANHAGVGGPAGRIPQDAANMYTVGIEIEHCGTGAEKWRSTQTTTATLAAAAIIRRLGASPRYCLSHHEWAPRRKHDPSGWDMPDWRGKVKRAVRVLDARDKAFRGAAPVRGVRSPRSLRVGNTGNLVVLTQAAVRCGTLTGTYGVGTAAGVRALQVAAGLSADGLVGARTWPVVLGVAPCLGLGDRGELVAVLQRLLGLRPAGVFGPKTKERVRAVQARRGLPVTGKVDPRTWAVLAR